MLGPACRPWRGDTLAACGRAFPPTCRHCRVRAGALRRIHVGVGGASCARTLTLSGSLRTQVPAPPDQLRLGPGSALLCRLSVGVRPPCCSSLPGPGCSQQKSRLPKPALGPSNLPSLGGREWPCTLATPPPRLRVCLQQRLLPSAPRSGALRLHPPRRLPAPAPALLGARPWQPRAADKRDARHRCPCVVQRRLPQQLGS